MKRSIPRSLVSKALEQGAASSKAADASAPEVKSATGPMKGAGSAWKAGALAQSQAAVDEAREALANDVLEGRHELLLQPDQLTDPLGTDRRDDWKDQDVYQKLFQSIEANGQDTPVVVVPQNDGWRPDPLAPLSVGDAKFVLLTGRRRHAVAAQLGRPVRAILAPQAMRSAVNQTFERLFVRFRENEERENLGAFERLLSIGEMYEALKADGGTLTAVAFAKRIGVHESVVSRARTVFARKDEILNAFKNVYDLSFGDLQKAIATLDQTQKLPASKPAKLTAKRKVGQRNLTLTHAKGALSVNVAGITVDQEQLEELSDLIARFLDKKKQRRDGADPKLRQL